MNFISQQSHSLQLALVLDQDDWETPDAQTIGWDYAEGKTITTWEGRSCDN